MRAGSVRHPRPEQFRFTITAVRRDWHYLNLPAQFQFIGERFCLSLPLLIVSIETQQCLLTDFE